jgi:metal-sulfur cluster biosynthetic enzyme
MTEQAVLDALGDVLDPEIGIDVVSLGLVYGVEIEGDLVRVALTMTSAACPLGPHLVEQAEAAIRARVPEAAAVRVDLVLDPPWTPERMTPEARRQLGWT